MEAVAIPEWNSRGVLPPISSEVPTSPMRAPYTVHLTELVRHFALTDARCSILQGLLQFRQQLHSVGLVKGFQWMDGSFCEDIERLEDRSPRDVDVVTFFYLPDGVTQEEIRDRNPSLFERGYVKKTFHVDSYFVQVNSRNPEYLIRQTTYWYSVWAHRRDGLWKGFVSVDLAPEKDCEASRELGDQMARVGLT